MSMAENDLSGAIAQMQGLFDRLSGLKQSWADDYQARFDSFSNRFMPIMEQGAADRRANAPDFNIFRYLELGEQEAFHSDFLRLLLDPKGSHDQETLFVETFLQTMQNSYPGLPLPTKPLRTGHWKVEREVFTPTPYGYLDLVLENRYLGAMYAIENKIYAGEQPDQIARYNAYLALHTRTFPYRALFFLTLDRRSPTSAGQSSCYCISYREEISAWLDHSLELVCAPTVRETVWQYRNLINRLA